MREYLDNTYIHYLILIVGTLLITRLLVYLTRRALDLFLQRSSKELQTDPTNYLFLKNSISFILYAIAIFWVFTKIPYFKTLGATLFASAGVLAAIVGFASQKAFSNIISGVFILIFKPFKVGDAVEFLSGKVGVVEEITLRHTVIRDYQHRRIIIPNNLISDDTIVNSSIADPRIRKFVEVGVAYEANLDHAEQIMRDIIEAHPNCLDNRTDQEIADNEPIVPIKVIRLGDYSITLRAFVWTQDIDHAYGLERDVLRSIKLAYDKEGVEIPYPHRTIVFKNKKNDRHE